MNMIGSDHIVENAEPIAFFSLKKPSDPVPAISSKFEQEFFFVTAMRDVPDVPWQKVATSARHFPPPLKHFIL
jgi:hypothetical protein